MNAEEDAPCIGASDCLSTAHSAACPNYVLQGSDESGEGLREARREAADWLHGKDRPGGLDCRVSGPLGLVRALIAEADDRLAAVQAEADVWRKTAEQQGSDESGERCICPPDWCYRGPGTEKCEGFSPDGTSDESGEGLSITDAEDSMLADWWVSEGGDHEDLALDSLTNVVERILADRLAAVQAERERESRRDHDRWRAEYAARVESAEAALATARRDADELRAEAWDEGHRFACEHQGRLDRDQHAARCPNPYRAALANPSAAQDSTEPHPQGSN